MHYLVYKTINTITGKIYIGVHKTLNKNDLYIGSGKMIQKAVKKYGRDCFVREIIFEASNSKEMYDKEKELVKIDKSKAYNLKNGGEGGWDYINTVLFANGRFVSEETKNKISLAVKKAYIKYGNKNIGRQHTEKARFNLKNSKLGKRNPNYGKTFSEEIKLKMSISHKGKTPSEETRIKMSLSRFGKTRGKYDACWITKDKTNKVVKKSLVNEYLNIGWSFGRTLTK